MFTWHLQYCKGDSAQKQIKMEFYTFVKPRFDFFFYFNVINILLLLSSFSSTAKANRPFYRSVLTDPTCGKKRGLELTLLRYKP